MLFFNTFSIELSLSLIFKITLGINNDHIRLKIKQQHYSIFRADCNGLNGSFLLPEDGVMLRNVVI